MPCILSTVILYNVMYFSTGEEGCSEGSGNPDAQEGIYTHDTVDSRLSISLLYTTTTANVLLLLQNLMEAVDLTVQALVQSLVV